MFRFGGAWSIIWGSKPTEAMCIHVYTVQTQVHETSDALQNVKQGSPNFYSCTHKNVCSYFARPTTYNYGNQFFDLKI